MRNAPGYIAWLSRLAPAFACSALLLMLASLPASALSEFHPRADSGDDGGKRAGPSAAPGLPMPDPLINRNAAAAQDTPPLSDTGEVILDLSTLPEPVRRMRELIVEAAASGDIDNLRPLTNPGPRQTEVNGEGEDPVETMKGFSGDPDGQEILAILLDILSTGTAHIDAGTPEEVYVWPYFAARPLSSLTAPERVELLRIVTAGDLMGMEESGNYSFYRIGITPDGEWKFFTGGD